MTQDDIIRAHGEQKAVLYGRIAELEPDAKVAGKHGYVYDEHVRGMVLGKKADGHPYPYQFADVWRPLDDDGDALRLRNRINAQLVDEGNFIFVGAYRYGIAAIEIREPYERDMPGGWASGGSVDAATRRAIVRAAAAIGEMM